jgi:hypothetical protein
MLLLRDLFKDMQESGFRWRPRCKFVEINHHPLVVVSRMKSRCNAGGYCFKRPYVPLLNLEKISAHSEALRASLLATMLRIPSKTEFSGVILDQSLLLPLPIVVSCEIWEAFEL